nr:NERD domain-containing protein [Rhizobium rhizogenes]
MWPSPLPRQIRQDPLRSSEVRVYDLLEEQLGPQWTVYYSRPYLKMTPTGAELDGEADFVVVHPIRGMLTIEVKGGEISRDSKTDHWFSRDRQNVLHKIKNPIQQAVSAQHTLIEKVRSLDTWPKGKFIRARHGVVFPHVTAPPTSLGADMPQEIFCCREELPNLGDWVRSRLSGGNEGPMGEAGMKAFQELLSLPFTLRVPLASYLTEDDQAIETLTPQQFYVLDAVSHLARVAAGGGAGTGKTIVACEDAFRLAEAGYKTALLCLGDKLAFHLRQRMKSSGVLVMTFPELCQHYASVSGLRTDFGEKEALEIGPDLLTRSVLIDPTLKLDAIVVDEAQDFRTQWWIALEDILVDPRTSKLHAFYDTNQSVYGDLAGELASFNIVPIRLSRNLRNTQAIHAAATRFYRGNAITSDGPQGFPVAWVICTIRSIEQKVLEILRELTVDGEVAPANICVLAPSDPLVKDLQTGLASFEELTVAHIRDFKGLECQAAIVVATKEMSDERELAYVALSRARAHLTIVGEAEIVDWLKEQS